MTLQQLKEQEIAEFEKWAQGTPKPTKELELKDFKEWVLSHDLRLEQAIREDERRKLKAELKRKWEEQKGVTIGEYRFAEEIIDTLLTLK